MVTAIYSVMHFLIDLISALSMFSFFASSKNFVVYLLLYNFCAFALQMPFGACVDLLILKNEEKDEKITCLTAGLGVLFTAIGAFTHPVILGIGNGLFHVGGGVGTIRSDFKKKLNGQALGIFVAPGALGLFLGTTLGKMNISKMVSALLVLTMVLLSSALFIFYFFSLIVKVKKKEIISFSKSGENRSKKTVLLLLVSVLLSFIVVVLRSYTGFAVSFSWKEGFLFGLLATLMAVFGKMSGGILSAKFGEKKVVLLSLFLSAVCFMLKDFIPFGLLSLLLFNMTMPITLYVLVRSDLRLSGFFFGLLTFALFLGYLPSYFQVQIPVDPRFIGTITSLISLVLLFLSVFILGEIKRKEEKR